MAQDPWKKLVSLSAHLLDHCLESLMAQDQWKELVSLLAHLLDLLIKIMPIDEICDLE